MEKRKTIVKNLRQNAATSSGQNRVNSLGQLLNETPEIKAMPTLIHFHLASFSETWNDCY